MTETAASYRFFFHTLIGQLIEFLGSIFSARTNHPVDKQNASNPAGGWKINHKIDRSMTEKALITKKNQVKIKWFWAIKRHHSVISKLSDGLFSLSAVVVTLCDWISTLKASSLLYFWLCAAALCDDQTSAMQRAFLLTFTAHKSKPSTPSQISKGFS